MGADALSKLGTQMLKNGEELGELVNEIEEERPLEDDIEGEEPLMIENVNTIPG